MKLGSQFELVLVLFFVRGPGFVAVVNLETLFHGCVLLAAGPNDPESILLCTLRKIFDLGIAFLQRFFLHLASHGMFREI